MMRLILILSIFILLVSNVYGQQKTIKGIVIDEHLELILSVTIFNTDTIEIGRTNIEREFNITIPESTNQLMFGFVGMVNYLI